ncbi:hypothetical protein N7452_005992 [Penicillium brevicompactum]|uniref:MutL C-terminal dimerisation domain-containing protein n=1 Tax=Penicillium brevicompactum TaxID=5074 RepID=A0A9W9QM35_PENBR|nr:hypothetical protein N7452_005992 [Penicillium brevicompactum]
MPLSQSIQALPSDVIAKLKSSTSIVNLPGVIVELIKNALDGNAHTIFVTVDFQRGGCIVEDDGDGIPPNEFEPAGGLGKAHHTSKYKQNDSYGHRGLFLASLASLSLLTLISHHIGDESTNSIIFHHSKPVARLIPAPSHQVLRSASHGTSVTVNDLFGNMPVRVKSRALSLQRTGEIEREWDNLRYALVSLLLANHQISRLVLLDAEKSKRMSIRPSISSSSASFSIGENAFSLRRIGSILIQSGLLTPRSWEHWHELSASVPDLTVQAAISLQASPTRKMQFITLGKEPLPSRNGSNILYNEINRLFSLSDFGNFDVLPSHAFPGPTRLVDQTEAQSNGTTKSWTKPINKWPMFFIRIETNAVLGLGDNDGREHFPESDKSIQRIVDVLGAMIHEFLKQHSMRPHSGKRQNPSSDRSQSIRSRDSVSLQSPGIGPQRGFPASSADEAFSGHFKIPSFPRSQASINHGQEFKNWSRIKAATAPERHSALQQSRRSVMGPDTNRLRGERPLSSRTERGLEVSDHRMGLDSSSQALDSLAVDEARETPEDHSAVVSSEKAITWVDPHTRLVYLINPRTGQTMNSRKSMATQSSHFSRTEDFSRGPEHGLWMQRLLETWDNPSFSRTEVPIPNLSSEAVTQYTSRASHGCFKGIGSLDTAQVAKFRGKLRRRGLDRAEVIAQVDKKFILAKVPTASPEGYEGAESNDVLLLIDQHAADERCRIEQLFEKMFLPSDENDGSNTGVSTVQVFLEFQVSETEGYLFSRYTNLFAPWGIHYDAKVKHSSTLVTVHALPMLIAERCRVEPQVLIDLMRREIWSTEEGGKRPAQAKKAFDLGEEDQAFEFLDIEDAAYKYPTLPSASHSWVQKMNGCPQGIVDLLNSRACRTAIMFNDPLDIGECEALLSRLARCAFPFQCAHGRPSMVPILDLRSVPDTATSLPLALDNSESVAEGTDLDYMEAFRARYIT